MNASERVKTEILKWDYFTNPANKVTLDIGDWKDYNSFREDCAGDEKLHSFQINITTICDNYELKVSFHPHNFKTEYYPDTISASAGINILDEKLSYLGVNKFCHTTGWESMWLNFLANTDNEVRKLLKKTETLIVKFKKYTNERGGARDDFKERVAKLTEGIDPAMLEVRGNDRFFKIGLPGTAAVVIKEHGIRWTMELPSFDKNELMAMLEGVKRYLLLKKMKDV